MSLYPSSAPEPVAELVATPSGDARVTWYRAATPYLVLALGHGAGGGIDAPDLRTLAERLPERGCTVALVEQPWRVAGKKLAPAPAKLDQAWREVWPALRAPALPVIAGGRSAGARVACRTARELGAQAVLALAFPLHPPGRPDKSRSAELDTGLPLRVVQGARDPFGRPEEFPDSVELVAVPEANHSFQVPARSTAVSQGGALDVLTDAVADWLPQHDTR